MDYAKLAGAMLNAMNGDEVSLFDIPKVFGAGDMLRAIASGELVVVPRELPDEVKAAMYANGYTPPNPSSTWMFILSKLYPDMFTPRGPLLAASKP